MSSAALAIPDMIAEIERQAATKADYIADSRSLMLTTADGGAGSSLMVPEHGSFHVTDLAHQQIGDHLEIPKRFYDKLRAAHPALLDANVNTLLRDVPSQRMVRTLDGKARAFLSNRYQRRDNWDLLSAIMPTIQAMPDAVIQALELTEKRLYLKCVLPRITAEVKLNDPVQAGFVLSNSEVGYGALAVELFVWRLVCLNGMIAPMRMRKIHAGRQAEFTEEAYQLYSDETLAADDRAFWLKVRDLVAGAADEAKFQQIVMQMGELVDSDPIADPIAGVQRLGETFGLSEGEGQSILTHLMAGGDLSAYGALNAITRAAQDVADYDRQIELERIGGKMLSIPKEAWLAIAA